MFVCMFVCMCVCLCVCVCVCLCVCLIFLTYIFFSFEVMELKNNYYLFFFLFPIFSCLICVLLQCCQCSLHMSVSEQCCQGGEGRGGAKVIAALPMLTISNLEAVLPI